jgi:hypothetical protein
MRSHVTTAQLDWQAGLNLNIPINTIEYFRLTYFRVTPYNRACAYQFTLQNPRNIFAYPLPRPEESIFAV